MILCYQWRDLLFIFLHFSRLLCITIIITEVLVNDITAIINLTMSWLNELTEHTEINL